MADDLTTLRNRSNAETLKAHRALLQALHETQQEHTSTLAGHTATPAQHTATPAQHTATLAEHTSPLADVRIGVHAILDLLDAHLARKSTRAGIAGMLRRIHPQPGSAGER
jgi:hypothetical protein